MGVDVLSNVKIILTRRSEFLKDKLKGKDL
jgi:hypothetical protein